MVQTYSSPVADEMVEEMLENLATELKNVVWRYAPKIRQLYRGVKDPQLLDSSVDWVIARLIRMLEQETGYHFDIASIHNLEDYLERRLVSER